MGPRRRTARPAGTWPPPGPFGWGWATPATAAGWSDASAGRAAWPGPEAPRAEAAWMPWLFALSAKPGQRQPDGLRATPADTADQVDSGLTVFTGVSGSGKSSLVFGTIAAESQRLINCTSARPRVLLQRPLGPSERCDHDRTRCRQDGETDLHPRRRHVSALRRPGTVSDIDLTQLFDDSNCTTSPPRADQGEGQRHQPHLREADPAGPDQKLDASRRAEVASKVAS